MSYGRILKPRIYPCSAANLALRGVAPSSIITLKAGTLNTGSAVADLMALRPLNLTSFDTSANATTHLVIQFDMQVATPVDFVCILNHNLYTAEGNIRVAYKDTAFSGAAGEGTAPALTYQVGSWDGYGRTTTNGSHILTFGSQTKRYWAVEIEDYSSFSATDLQIGAILIGSYWTAPYAPDLDIQRTYEMDGVDIAETRGGRRYANAGWVTGSDGVALPFGVPFRTDGLNSAGGAVTEMLAGRETYRMSYSRLDDTSVMPSDQSAGMGTGGWRSVMSRMGNGALPCVFGVDSTSTTAGDYLFARVTPGAERQVAPKVWTVDARIEQEF